MLEPELCLGKNMARYSVELTCIIFLMGFPSAQFFGKLHHLPSRIVSIRHIILAKVMIPLHHHLHQHGPILGNDAVQLSPTIFASPKSIPPSLSFSH